MGPTPLGFDAAVERARALASASGRRLLGVAGPPGAGKTTLATGLVAALGADAVAVPMDGFHLADAALAALGRTDRKGAIDTFDGFGYLALLRRLRTQTGETVYAPAFERDLEQPVAGSIAVAPTTPLVVSEGNYLLADVPPWPEVAACFDEVWWVDADPALRFERLVARHVRFGKSPVAAREWVGRVDEPNASLVAGGRERADVVVEAVG